MRDFDRRDFIGRLSREADEVLNQVDMLLRYTEKEHVILTQRQWDSLDRSMRDATRGEKSLTTHAYAGVRLIRRETP